MYLHTQRSRPLMMVLLAAALVPFVIFLSEQGRDMPLGARITLGVSVVAIAMSALVFSSLTIRVGDGQLTWFFGPGILEKSVAVAAIADAMPTRTTLLEGWGIHLTRRGWLYNVAGRDAVLFTLRDGTRFLLGTDEPKALEEAVRDVQGVPGPGAPTNAAPVMPSRSR